jgi:hypothetical protein
MDATVWNKQLTMKALQLIAVERQYNPLALHWSDTNINQDRLIGHIMDVLTMIFALKKGKATLSKSSTERGWSRYIWQKCLWQHHRLQRQQVHLHSNFTLTSL